MARHRNIQGVTNFGNPRLSPEQTEIRALLTQINCLKRVKRSKPFSVENLVKYGSGNIRLVTPERVARTDSLVKLAISQGYITLDEKGNVDYTSKGLDLMPSHCGYSPDISRAVLQAQRTFYKGDRSSFRGFRGGE